MEMAKVNLFGLAMSRSMSLLSSARPTVGQVGDVFGRLAGLVVHLTDKM